MFPCPFSPPNSEAAPLPPVHIPTQCRLLNPRASCVVTPRVLRSPSRSQLPARRCPHVLRCCPPLGSILSCRRTRLLRCRRPPHSLLPLPADGAGSPTPVASPGSVRQLLRPLDAARRPPPPCHPILPTPLPTAPHLP
jgi:hypothetical protein